MWLTAAIAILTILAGLTGTIAGFLYSAGHKELSVQYLIACIAFSCVDIFLVIMKAAHKAKPTKELAANRHPRHVKHFKFGVFWDSLLTPYCPVCRTPLTLSTKLLIHDIRDTPTPVPHCFKCNEIVDLYDDHGKALTLAEAKQLLSPKTPDTESSKTETPKLNTAEPRKQSKEPETKAEPIEKQNSEPQPPEDYKPGKTETEVLKYISETDRPNPIKDLPEKLNKPALLIEACIHALIKYGYVAFSPNATLPGGNVYGLASKGIDFLNQPDYRGIPHPSGTGDAPNETEERILIHLAHPNCLPFLDGISIALELNPTRTQFHLTELIKRGYINVDSFNEWHDARYSLTQKGRKYLIERNLID